MVDSDEKNEFVKAKETVFRLLKFRPRSKKEIIDKLETKNISNESIQKVLQYFEKLEFIDDRQFAQGWIQSRLNKPYGIYRIRLELKRKGISKEISSTELNKATEIYDEVEKVTILVNKRLPKYDRLDTITKKRRLFGYLARRGFSSTSIQKVIRELV